MYPFDFYNLNHRLFIDVYLIYSFPVSKSIRHLDRIIFNIKLPVVFWYHSSYSSVPITPFSHLYLSCSSAYFHFLEYSIPADSNSLMMMMMMMMMMMLLLLLLFSPIFSPLLPISFPSPFAILLTIIPFVIVFR